MLKLQVLIYTTGAFMGKDKKHPEQMGLPPDEIECSETPLTAAVLYGPSEKEF